MEYILQINSLVAYKIDIKIKSVWSEITWIDWCGRTSNKNHSKLNMYNVAPLDTHATITL